MLGAFCKYVQFINCAVPNSWWLKCITCIVHSINCTVLTRALTLILTLNITMSAEAQFGVHVCTPDSTNSQNVPDGNKSYCSKCCVVVCLEHSPS